MQASFGRVWGGDHYKETNGSQGGTNLSPANSDMHSLLPLSLCLSNSFVPKSKVPNSDDEVTCRARD